MLIVDWQKRRCVILHGDADTGKSHIAKIMDKIFDSYMKNETKTNFDEKISNQEANCQLLIMNEANVFELFKKKNMARIKRLTEGQGTSLENKFGHPFTGFVESF